MLIPGTQPISPILSSTSRATLMYAIEGISDFLILKEIREKDVEGLLVKETRKKGGMAIKLTSPSCSGLPDRMILLPGGRIFFVELKAPGRKTRKLQDAVIAAIRRLGFRVEVVDSKDKIEEVLNDL